MVADRGLLGSLRPEFGEAGAPEFFAGPRPA